MIDYSIGHHQPCQNMFRGDLLFMLYYFLCISYYYDDDDDVALFFYYYICTHNLDVID